MTCTHTQYIPGIIATLALIMINCIRRDELQEADPFDDAGYCRCEYIRIYRYVLHAFDLSCGCVCLRESVGMSQYTFVHARIQRDELRKLICSIPSAASVCVRVRVHVCVHRTHTSEKDTHAHVYVHTQSHTHTVTHTHTQSHTHTHSMQAPLLAIPVIRGVVWLRHRGCVGVDSSLR